MAEKFKDQDFLEYLAKALATHPDDVQVSRKVDERGVLLTLKVHQEDMGRILGRSGNTAKAIRTLVKIVGRSNNALVNLKIEEPEGSDWKARQASVRADSASKSADEVMDDLKL
ncbi:MAG: KH domain-containing protein [Patescibacteria group bacterium]